MSKNRQNHKTHAGILPRRAGWILSLAALFVWPVVCYIVSEEAMATGCNYLHIYRYSIAMNIWLYCVVEGVILALTLNIRTAVLGSTIWMTIFSASNIYLMEFRQIPLYLTDLVDIRTAGDVAGSYHFDLNRGIILLIGFFVGSFVIMHLIWPRKQKYILRLRWLWRTVLIPIALAAAIWTGHYLIFTSAPAKHGVSMSSFRPIKSYVKNGGLLTFVRSGKFLVIDKPEGYSKEAIADLEERYESDSASAASAVPNVIAIMDEAFADLQSVGSFETNQDVMPFYHGLKENTIKGDLYVSVFGGHTANTEYEFLTGDSYALCPSGTPYVLYVKENMPNLTTSLKALGTQGNLSMHPNNAANYNRENVYASFGFEHFIAIGEFQDAERVRGNVSDKADFDRIISEYEAAKAASDDPFYLFTVTMQNHSGYEANDDNLPQEIKITSEGVEDKEQAERYLNLIHLTDQRLGELVTYFEGVKDPTVIVFFGDHEPGLSDAFYDSILPKPHKKMSNEEEMCLYKTPYLIWANFDIQEEEVDLSANYLQMKVKEAAGLPMTGYDHFLKDLSRKLPIYCGAGSIDAEGNYASASVSKNPYSEEIKAYSYLVYNHLFDQKNWSRMFYLK